MNYDRHNLNIPLKANKILNIILVALLLILIRVWHLAVVQYEEKLQESRKPQRKIIVEPAKRATIRDRFNQPLAINKMQYNAAIVYAPLKDIPHVRWEKDEQGNKVKKFKRREYIEKLATVLAEELDLNKDRLIDLIYAKAALYYSLPFVIKEDITEQQYYRLKFLEKDYAGIQVKRIPKRYYPRGKIGADIIGYMGAINREEYESILEEIQTLEIFLKECDEGVSPELPCGVLTQEQAAKRLKDLQEHAYSINDYVGKAGIEKKYEQELRGYYGKKMFYSDAKGNFLRELPGSRHSIPGQRLLLTISSELQEYAETLLVQNETVRDTRASMPTNTKQVIHGLRSPWIKGGSILAIDPKTGEIVAMASHPRFDPNDFIACGDADANRQKQHNICKWFENESYIAALWDQKKPLEREIFDQDRETLTEERVDLSWEKYLEFILPKASPIVAQLQAHGTILRSINLQNKINKLLALSGQEDLYAALNALYTEEGHQPYPQKPSPAKQLIEEKFKLNQKEVAMLKKNLDSYLSPLLENYDKVLYVDLNRLAINGDFFNKQLLSLVGKYSFSAFKNASSAKTIISETVKKMAKLLFRELDFKEWRRLNEKKFLKEKRDYETKNKLYSKPYIDYLDKQEDILFQDFWGQQQDRLLLAFLKGSLPESPSSIEVLPYLEYFKKWHDELALGAHSQVEWRNAYQTLSSLLKPLDDLIVIQFLKTMRGYDELTRPLYGKYRHLRKNNGIHLEKHLAAGFYPLKGFGYGRSQAYRQAAPQGSIFKLVTAYAALCQNYQKVGEKNATFKTLNPLDIIDHTHRKGKDTYIGFNLEGKPIPRAYKGGRLPRSTRVMGKLDLLKAIETSSNPYFSLLAGDFLKSPDELINAAKQFSYGSRTGINLPYEISGGIPDDLNTNRTGLYSTAIGQHSLVVTPMQTSIMLSSIANGGKIMKPKIVNLAVGKRPRRRNDSYQFPYQNLLALVGLDFPLLAGGLDDDHMQITHYPPIVQRKIFMPTIIRKILLEGMQRVVYKTQEESLSSLSRLYRDYPEAISDYLDLREDFVGKTSTAEVMEFLDLDLHTGTNLYTHVWFGGISFDKHAKPTEFIFRDEFGEPELVVVAYLCYGAYGKEAAPVAAQMVKKWREIKEKYKKH